MILKHNKGVTLIELMIVMVIAAVLVAGIYSLFMTQQRSYFVQDQVSGVQQDARVALDLMARDIRMAGFQTGPGSEDVGFNGIILFGDDADPFNDCQYAVGAGSGSIALVTATDTGLRVLGINEADPNDNYVYLEGLAAGVGSYIAFEGLNKVYVIQAIDPARTYPADPTESVPAITLTNSRITPNPTLPPPDHLSTLGGGVSGAGARVYLISVIRYNISGDSLRRNGQPLAGDGTTTVVQSLQFAYQVEGDTSWYSTPDDFPAGMTEEYIRMVRIAITVRTAVPDPEDESYRSRDYSTVVKVRNL